MIVCMSGMPAVSAQSGVPSGAGNSGTPHVVGAQPVDGVLPSVPSPAPISNDRLITSSAPGSGLAGPCDVGSGGSLGGATRPGVGVVDCRVIDVPGRPSASGGPDEATLGHQGISQSAPRPV